MRIVNIEDAKTHLSRLVAEAAAGEPFIIAVDGKPLVRVVRVVSVDAPAAGTKRRLGFMEGQVTIPVDFDHVGAVEIEATARCTRPTLGRPQRKFGITWSP